MALRRLRYTRKGKALVAPLTVLFWVFTASAEVAEIASTMLPNPLKDFEVSNDGRVVATADGSVRLYRLPSMENFATIDPPLGTTYHRVAISADGNFVAFASPDVGVYVYDVLANTQFTVLDPLGSLWEYDQGVEAELKSLALTPDARYIASATRLTHISYKGGALESNNAVYSVVDATTGDKVYEHVWRDGLAGVIEFSDDSHRVVYQSRETEPWSSCVVEDRLLWIHNLLECTAIAIPQKDSLQLIISRGDRMVFHMKKCDLRGIADMIDLRTLESVPTDAWILSAGKIVPLGTNTDLAVVSGSRAKLVRGGSVVHTITASGSAILWLDQAGEQGQLVFVESITAGRRLVLLDISSVLPPEPAVPGPEEAGAASPIPCIDHTRTPFGVPEALNADTERDYSVSLSELLAAIQLYNGGEFHNWNSLLDLAAWQDPDNKSEGLILWEDGYAPGPGNRSGPPYDLDRSPQDWRLQLSELLRLIQIYNAGAYHYCPDAGTEDGFCPGP